MPFEKGHKLGKGRPKGSPNRVKKSLLQTSYKDLYESLAGSFKSGKYYVYYHIDSDTKEILYIGKGSGDRAWRFNKKERNPLWQEYKLNNNLEVKIIASFLSELEAFAIEKSLIETIKPRLNIVYAITK